MDGKRNRAHRPKLAIGIYTTPGNGEQALLQPLPLTSPAAETDLKKRI